MHEINLFIKLTFFEGFGEFGLIVAFLNISHTIFAVQSVTFGLLFVQCSAHGMLLDRRRHGLQTPHEAFFHRKSQSFGLGQIIFVR